MIDIDKLRAVSVIVCHAYPELPCPDGTASALLLRDALPGARVLFVSHGESLAALKPEPGMLFCDIAPAPETAEKFVAAGAIVLDHHRTARSVVVEQFGPLGVFADEEKEPGVSGAVLAFREVWLPIVYPIGRSTPREGAAAERFAKLAGIRDTWQRQHDLWPEACAQGEALTFWDWSLLPMHPFTGNRLSSDMQSCLAVGPILIARRARRVKKLVAQGQRLSTDGTRVLIIPSLETSDVAEAVRDEVDLVVGFGYEVNGEGAPIMVLSLRSNGKFDAGGFCHAKGGGGHTRAAGCEVPVYFDDVQPFTKIFEMLHAWETRRK